jgi:hypothetical protein
VVFEEAMTGWSTQRKIEHTTHLSWIGGWRGLALVLGLQALVAVGMVLDARYAFLAILGFAAVFAVVERPILGVAVLIAARLLDVSQNAFIHIGPVSIGYFEPTLLLAGGALVVHVIRERDRKITAWSWPWQLPFMLFMAFATVSLGWSAKLTEGLGDVSSLIVILANSVVILYFVRTPRQFLFILYTWVAASVVIGLATEISDVLGISDSGPWKAAAGGGRETGLGQQPNWYAMNLMFIVHTTFGLAIVQARRRWRWLLILAGLFIFVNMMRSGSRGGAYAVLIGGALTAMALPVFRKWFFRFLIVATIVFVAALTLDWGSTSMAFGRIYENVDRTWSAYRPMNWLVCIQEFIDTWGRGIGAGGYVTLLPKYNWYLYESVYRYPHGIFWSLMCHFGVVGLGLFAWIALRVAQMARKVTTWTRNTALEVVAWTMPATMLSYAAWSFVEFEFNDKPFWEFLALYTALYSIVKEHFEKGVPLPALEPGARPVWERVRRVVKGLGGKETSPPIPDGPVDDALPRRDDG